MSLLEKFRKQSMEVQSTIVLPEGEEARTVEAAAIILKGKLANLVLLGDEKRVTEGLKAHGVTELPTIINPKKDPRLKEYTEEYYEMRKSKGITMEEANKDMSDPAFFGCMLVRKGVVDGAVMGAQYTTSSVLRAGLRVIGVKAGGGTVSSCFVMVTNKKEFGKDGVVLFADCAVNPDPTAEMLSDIAVSTAETYKAFMNDTPRVAMLSFATKGSAKSDSTLKMIEATKILNERAPELAADGEMQADAALVAAVGKIKAPNSKVAGRANILVFPNLDAANISYKLVERFGDATAIGPIFQGFAKPLNDLSRGCSVEDIVNVVAITSVQAKLIY